MKKYLIILFLISLNLFATNSDNHKIRSKFDIELRPAVATLAYGNFVLESGAVTLLDLISTPANPSPGYFKFYPKNGLFFKLDSAGNEVPVGTGGGFDNLLNDGDYEITGQNNLTCGTGNTCSQTKVAGEFTNGEAGLKVVMGGSNLVSVKHCFANTGDAWLNRMAQVSASIKSTITDLQFCYNNNTSDEQCVSVGNAANFVKVIARSGVNSGEQICYRLKSNANPTVGAEIFIDNAKAGEFDVDGTTKVLKQSITHVLGGDSLLDRTGTVQFNSANLSNVGDSILTIDNTGDPTRFICSKPKCYVDVSQSGFHGATGAQTGIYINGVKRINGSKTYTSSVQSTVSREFELNQNDYITIGDDDVANNANPYDLGIVAKAYEQADVLTQDGFSGVDVKWVSPLCDPPLGTTPDGSYNQIIDGDCVATVQNGAFTPFAGSTAIGGYRHFNAGNYEVCFNFTQNMEVAGGGTLNQFFESGFCSGTTACTSPTVIYANNSGLSPITNKVSTKALPSLCGLMKIESEGIYSVVLREGTFGAASVDANNILSAEPSRFINMSIKPHAQTIIGTFGAAVNSTIVHLKEGILTPATQRNPVNYDTVIYDPDNNFNIATDEYTIPEDGVYVFQAGILVNTMASSTYGEIDIFNSTTGNTLGISTDTDGGDIVGHRRVVTVTHYGTKGHTIRVRVFTGVNHVIPATTNEFMFFSATKVDQAGVINQNPIQQSETKAADNSFTGGSILIEKNGKIICLSAIGSLTWASAISVSTSVGFLPTWARPIQVITNIFDADGTKIKRARIDSNGEVAFNFKDYSGVDIVDNGTGSFSQCYSTQ